MKGTNGFVERRQKINEFETIEKLLLTLITIILKISENKIDSYEKQKKDGLPKIIIRSALMKLLC
jgi:hypothetical protein